MLFMNKQNNIHFFLPETQSRLELYSTSNYKTIEWEFNYFPESEQLVFLKTIKYNQMDKKTILSNVLVFNSDKLVSILDLENYQGNTLVLSNNYTYISIPDRIGETITWEYDYDESIHVECSSTLTMTNIQGQLHRTLIVERNIAGNLVREYYVYGQGLTNIEIDDQFQDDLHIKDLNFITHTK